MRRAVTQRAIEMVISDSRQWRSRSALRKSWVGNDSSIYDPQACSAGDRRSGGVLFSLAGIEGIILDLLPHSIY